MDLGELFCRSWGSAEFRKLAYDARPRDLESVLLTDDIATQKQWSLHEILLAGWGCPIGELFDLEKLSEHCKKVNRWSYFIASEVCNVAGSVAR